MTDTTAKVRAKGLDATGVTEEIAEKMYAHKGKHYMAIVEVMVDERHDKAGGKKRVDLVIEQFEPAIDGDLADHLRELTRTLYQTRTAAGTQRTIDDELDNEPTVEQVVAAGGRFEPHPFLPVDVSADNPICDVCGLVQDVGVHDLAESDDAREPGEDDQGDDAPTTTGYDDPFTVPNSNDEEPALT